MTVMVRGSLLVAREMIAQSNAPGFVLRYYLLRDLRTPSVSPWKPLLIYPRVDDLKREVGEIFDVTGYQNQIVRKCGSSQQTIDGRKGPPSRCNHTPPSVCHLGVNWQNAAGKESG